MDIKQLTAKRTSLDEEIRQLKAAPSSSPSQLAPAKPIKSKRRIPINMNRLVHNKFSHGVAYFLLIVVILQPIFTSIFRPGLTGAVPGTGTSGKGIIGYSDGTTTPPYRIWSPGATAAGGEGTTVSSRNALQSAMVASPSINNEWLMAIADASGNLEVLRSSNGGSTWSISLAAATIGSIGGTGVTRRFDIAYEQQSGDAILAYSKNATTNEIATRRWDGSSWSSETTFDPGGTDSVVTIIELAEKRLSDELALGYVTNDTTATIVNVGAAIWDGSSNALGNATSAGNTGQCDQATAGSDRCMDIVYETGSGAPILVWGFTNTAAATSNIRSVRWSAGAWTATSYSTFTADDATHLDCAANPLTASSEVACVSLGNDQADSQSWTLNAGAIGTTFANIDTTGLAAAAGRMHVAIEYAVDGGVAHAVAAVTDSAADTGFDFTVWNGSTWSSITASTVGYTTQESNMVAIPNGRDIIFLVVDSASDLFCSRLPFDGAIAAADFSRCDGGAALEASIASLTGSPISMGFEPAKPKPLLEQKGYIWEMDDATGDAAAQLAAGNTAITMRAGERATLRAQLRNTGGPIDLENLGLFYDRNDGLWSKVKNSAAAITGGGNCDNTVTFPGSTGSDAWQCTVVDDQTENVGSHSSLAFSPNGTPYVSHQNNTDGSLTVSNYVGSGGNCDTYAAGSTGSDAWQCTLVMDAATALGFFSSLVFSPSGVPYVSFLDTGDGSVWIAQYVGSGGTGCTGGPTTWSCIKIDDQSDTLNSSYGTLAFSPAGTPYVSYRNVTDGSLIVSNYVGSGGNCDTYATLSTGSDAWQCMVVDDQTDTVGLYTSIAFSPNGTPYVSYQNSTEGSLTVSYYVGSGGNCDNTVTFPGSTGSDAWQCTVVDDQTDAVGLYTSLAFSPNGTPYVSYQNSSDGSLLVANYLGGGSGNCNSYASGSSGSSDWQCTVVDDQTDGAGIYSSLAFSPAGTPFVSYQNSSDGSTIVSHYVGSGGNCDNTVTFPGSTGSDAWQCTVVDDQTDAVGLYTSLAFSPNGTPYVSYHNNDDDSLIVAQLYRSGEILISPSYGGESTFSESHADMSSTTDTTGRDNNDCLTSGTFNTGKYFLGEEGTGLSMNGGYSTAQCIEVAFTIDTSQAVAGATYRFVIALDDSLNASRGLWRGPVVVSSYPTLTIENDALYTTHQTASKDSLYTLPNCTSSSWGCAAINATGDVGWDSDIAMDPSGNAWVTYIDDNDASLSVARYVGSGGNCDSTGGSDAWQCYKVEDDGSILYGSPAIAFSPTGEAWVAYQEANPNFNLKIARFVGSGGNCDDTAWQCTTVEATNSVGSEAAIAVTSTGIPWVSYLDNTNGNLRVANYVGSGGNCDATGGSDAWQCTLVDATDTVGSESSIAMSSNDTPWVSYRDAGSNNNLEVAQYVGSGGDCDTVGAGSDAWECTTVDVTDSLAATTSIAFNASGVAWVAYSDVTNSNLEVATYVGAGGNCDAVGAGSDAWQCSTVAATRVSTTGAEASLAFDTSGNAWIAHRNVANLEVARFVTSGGSCSNTAWQCTTVDTVSDVSGGIGGFSTIAFDQAGNPWVAYYQVPNDDLRIAVYKDTAIAPAYTVTNTQSSRNAKTSFGRYALSNGKPSASTSTTCTSASNFLGLCGITQEDGQHESVSAVANHRPMLQMRARFNNNAVLPTITWAGESSIAASTSTLTLQVYRYGSTNTWETVATNTTCGANAACVISGNPTGTMSEYFETSGSNYWVYIRVVQAAHTSSTTTLKTDMLKALQPQQQMRHGRTFSRDLLQPFDTTQR